MMENDQKLGLYEVYGDKKEDIVENISQNTEDSGKKSTLKVENEVNDGKILQSEEDAELFFDTIENPPTPVDALIEAKEKYEEDLKKKSLKI